MGAVIENRVVRSTVQDLYIPEVDVATFIREACERFRDRTAIIDDCSGRRYTYGDLQVLSTRVAAGLWTRGFRPGQMAGLHCGTSPEMLFAFYGVMFAGGRVVFAKSELTQREVEYHFRDACPNLVFCDEKTAKKAQAACEAIPSVETLVVFGNYEGLVPMASLLRTPLDGFETPAMANPDATAAVLYSTGTTGLPKGIVISHRIVVAQSLISGSCGKYVESTDTMLGNLPFTHVSGVWLYGTVFSVGGTVVLITKKEMKEVLSTIEKHKVTMMFHFPAFALKMLHSGLLERYDISSLKKIVIGGSPLPSIVGAGIVAKLGLDSFRYGYGMTETFGGATVVPINAKEYDNVGFPVPMTHIKVVDVDTREKLGAGEHGEICVKGPICTPGYFKHSENTPELYDSEGFLMTGDIGFYSEDGHFFVVDRIKEMIKCMDRQVAPAELEEILLKHPSVKEVVVVGVPHHEYGEAARAFVILHDYVLGDEGTERELCALVEDQCARYKHLHGGLEFVSNLPRSDNGKYLRRALRDAFVATSFSE